MRLLKTLTLTALTLAGLGGLSGAAQAHEAWCEQVFVPAHYETRMERCEEPRRWVIEERVVESPGHYVTRYETVETPGRWERVERQVWVEGRWVERGPVHAGLQIGRIGDTRIKVAFGAGREWMAAHYETRCETVWVPPTCVRKPVQVWVPGCKRVEQVRVWKPGRVVQRPTNVYVPARWDIRCKPAPETCPPAPGSRPHKGDRRA